MLLLLLAAACAHSPPSEASAPPAPEVPASPAPNPVATAPAELPLLDGPALSALLKNPGGRPLVVNFWATWCGPCVRELAMFAEVAAGVDARFALVSVDDRRDHDRVRVFLAAQGITLPAWHLDAEDPAGMLVRTVPQWPELVPVTLVLEPGGAVRARFAGAVSAEALRAALAP